MCHGSCVRSCWLHPVCSGLASIPPSQPPHPSVAAAAGDSSPAWPPPSPARDPWRSTASGHGTSSGALARRSCMLRLWSTRSVQRPAQKEVLYPLGTFMLCTPTYKMHDSVTHSHDAAAMCRSRSWLSACCAARTARRRRTRRCCTVASSRRTPSTGMSTSQPVPRTGGRGLPHAMLALHQWMHNHWVRRALHRFVFSPTMHNMQARQQAAKPQPTPCPIGCLIGCER